MNDLVAGEPGDGLGLDLIGTCLAHHLLPRRRDDGARIADRLPEAAWQSGFREPTRCREDRIFAEMGDGRGHRGLRVVHSGRRHQELGDVRLELDVGRAVFGAVEAAEARAAIIDGDLRTAQVTVGDPVVVGKTK